MIEYRKINMVLNQQAPEGSTGKGFDNGLLWRGESNSLSNEYNSVVLTLDQVKSIFLSELQTKTYSIIESKMPQWRLNRWRRYYDLRNKVLSNIQLNPVEQSEYDCFPDISETHEDCDAYVGPCLIWCGSVITEHNRVVDAIKNATTVEAVEAAFDSVNYPQFLL